MRLSRRRARRGERFLLDMDWPELVGIYRLACHSQTKPLQRAVEAGVGRGLMARVAGSPPDPPGDLPLVVTGPGGDYRRGWTPAVRGNARGTQRGSREALASTAV